MEQEKKYTKEEYNAEPVLYCKECLSLKIIGWDDQSCFCDECGNTNIGKASIEAWEDLYETRYKHKYLKLYGRKSKQDSQYGW